MPRRVRVHINCASTLDGRIAMPDGARLVISTPWDKRRVHRLRKELGAILVGSGTVLYDDPKLTVDPELAGGPAPLTKIVLDGRGRVPASARFLHTEGRSVIVISPEADPEWVDRMKALGERVPLEVMTMAEEGRTYWSSLWDELYDKGTRGVLVEGGSDTIASLVESGEFDVLTIFYAPIAIGGHGPAIMGGMGFSSPVRLRISSYQTPPGGGLLVEYVRT